MRASTTIAGTPTGRAASTATAPAATAAAAKSCPSERAPGSARNSPPGVTARESNSTVPVTRVRAASCGEMSAQLTTDDVGDLGQGQVDHARDPNASSAPASSSRSSNGRVWPWLVWPASWPLPAISTTSPSPGPADRVVDGRPPVADLDDLGGRRRRGGARHDRRADRGRILVARVVVGDDDQVGEFGRDPTHRLALALVAVAARAEHHGEPAGGSAARSVSSTARSAPGLCA